MKAAVRWWLRALGGYPVTHVYLCVMVTVIVVLLLMADDPVVCHR